MHLEEKILFEEKKNLDLQLVRAGKLDWEAQVIPALLNLLECGVRVGLKRASLVLQKVRKRDLLFLWEAQK